MTLNSDKSDIRVNGLKDFLFLYRANVESVDEENEEGLSLEKVNISPKIAEGLYSEKSVLKMS